MSEQPTFATTRPGLLIDQYDTSYAMLRERLEGLTDAEYFWEPVPACWSVRRRAEAKTTLTFGKGEWVFEREPRDPQPAPFTTIAWRIAHVVSGQMMRCDYTFGTKSLDWNDIEFPGSAAGALAFWRVRIQPGAPDWPVSPMLIWMSWGLVRFPTGLTRIFPLARCSGGQIERSSTTAAKLGSCAICGSFNAELCHVLRSRR